MLFDVSSTVALSRACMYLVSVFFFQPGLLLCCDFAQVRTGSEKHCYLTLVKSDSSQILLDSLMRVWALVPVNQCSALFRGGAAVCLHVCLVGYLAPDQGHGQSETTLMTSITQHNKQGN